MKTFSTQFSLITIFLIISTICLLLLFTQTRKNRDNSPNTVETVDNPNYITIHTGETVYYIDLNNKVVDSEDGPTIAFDDMYSLYEFIEHVTIVTANKANGIESVNDSVINLKSFQ